MTMNDETGHLTGPSHGRRDLSRYEIAVRS
jgi:hypothetical protein